MTFAVCLRGHGQVELAATSLNDAEHQVVKELGGLFSGASVRVEEIRRTTRGPQRIAEDFVVTFVLEATLTAPARDAAQARSESLRVARLRLAGTRYRSISWDRTDVRHAGEQAAPRDRQRADSSGAA